MLGAEPPFPASQPPPTRPLRTRGCCAFFLAAGAHVGHCLGLAPLLLIWAGGGQEASAQPWAAVPPASALQTPPQAPPGTWGTPLGTAHFRGPGEGRLQCQGTLLISPGASQWGIFQGHPPAKPSPPAAESRAHTLKDGKGNHRRPRSSCSALRSEPRHYLAWAWWSSDKALIAK